jgi:hypothetical protein
VTATASAMKTSSPSILVRIDLVLKAILVTPARSLP